MTQYQQLARTPLKQVSNRVWRTYRGGARIDEWKGAESVHDSNLPEEWIMSTISARGNGRPPEEGLSILKTPEGHISLQELIQNAPELFLGEHLAKKYGSTAVLIKVLDAAERLTIQVHPDKEFARTYLDSEFGKTESWYVLGGRDIDGEPSAVYLGFKENVTPDLWMELFRKQDNEAMLNCLHRFDVQLGDAFMIYGGVPHAIGAGCLLLEVQEPTDYTMRVEKITPGGLEISPELIHQGVGDENMLKCFHYEACTRDEANQRWKVTPHMIETSDNHTLRSVFNESHTECFGLRELDLKGSFELRGNGSFLVAVIYSGKGMIKCNGEDFPYQQGDEYFISAAIEDLTFESSRDSKILLCYPPT